MDPTFLILSKPDRMSRLLSLFRQRVVPLWVLILRSAPIRLGKRPHNLAAARGLGAVMVDKLFDGLKKHMDCTLDSRARSCTSDKC